MNVHVTLDRAESLEITFANLTHKHVHVQLERYQAIREFAVVFHLVNAGQMRFHLVQALQKLTAYGAGQIGNVHVHDQTLRDVRLQDAVNQFLVVFGGVLAEFCCALEYIRTIETQESLPASAFEGRHVRIF